MLPESVANNGWNPNQWDELETFARETVDRQAKLRHLIPRGPDAPGPQPISMPVHSVSNTAVLTRTFSTSTAAYTRWCRFDIAPEQIGDAETARTLVERAARILASDEDGVLFDWLCSAPALGPSSQPIFVDRIRQATDLIESNSFGAPYVLAWSDGVWSTAIDTSAPAWVRGQRDAVLAGFGTGGALVRVPVTRAAGTPAPPTKKGAAGVTYAVVFARDAFGLDLVFAEPPTIALVGYASATLELRLEQRFLLRIHDAGCARCLESPP